MTGYDKAKEVVEELKKEKTMIVKDEHVQALARPIVTTGLGIRGLEDEDPSILPIPFVRVVQGQSKDTKMKDGKDAPEGHFFFNDTREAVETLTFCLLKSKVIVVNFERDGEIKPTTQRKILGVTMDTKKVFMLTISIGSFANYGRLVAEMKTNKITDAWSHMITAKTVKTENEKGKFYTVEFTLGEELTKEDKEEMGLSFEQFKNIFEKKEEATDMPF